MTTTDPSTIAIDAAIGRAVRQWLTQNNGLVLQHVHDAVLDAMTDVFTHKVKFDSSVRLAIKNATREFLDAHADEVIAAAVQTMADNNGECAE